MSFRPSGTLRSRTFIGLLVAQFLAAFNDQAIHASAMFFAFHKHLLSEAQAISLMPILFYAPWALFCTLAGYYADRYSKRASLVFWKFAEIAICLVALLGFYLGDERGLKAGPAIVLGCVFLMGVHSAFFVPAKYGAMPEILQPEILSRGNGILESLSFLAVILGTVCGGVLSDVFRGDETWIGVVFLGLAVVGAAASLVIEKMPAANPGRPFPPYVFGPLKQSLKTLLSSRPLVLAVVGIAFFTFVVAYMRQTVYMLGESQSPRWSETKTSLIVGSTALGIGLGSPLAGWLSGRKVELGLVPLGGIGMVLAAVVASFCLRWVPGLAACIIAIGFFTGFYLVPLYTLLQHRAPKSSVGDAVAVSNFINVTGAILASALFFVLVTSFQRLGYAPTIPFTDGPEVWLTSIESDEGRITDFTIEGTPAPITNIPKRVFIAGAGVPLGGVEPAAFELLFVDRATYRGVEYYYLRMPDETRPPIYDNTTLPGFLFLGAAAITALILLVLCVILPDLPRRAVWACRTLVGPRVRAVGTHRVPQTAGVLFVTNGRTAADQNFLRSATDRLITFLTKTEAARAGELLAEGRVVAIEDDASMPSVRPGCPVLPVSVTSTGTEVCVAFGSELTGDITADGIVRAIRAAGQSTDAADGH